MASNDKDNEVKTVEGGMRLAPAKKTVRSPDFKSMYLNNIQLGYTRFDFQMVLGLVEVSKDEAFQDVVVETACLKMTPGYAKALLSDMIGTIKRYEDLYGEIPIPLPLDKPLKKE